MVIKLNRGVLIEPLESLVKNTPIGAKNPSVKSSILNTSEHVFKEFLIDRLTAKVSIQKKVNGSGKLSVHFNSESDLNRIIELLKQK